MCVGNKACKKCEKKMARAKESSGRRAMRLEAMSKMAKNQPHHTRLKNTKPKGPDLTTEYEAEGKAAAKPKKKKGPGKGNVPNPY